MGENRARPCDSPAAQHRDVVFPQGRAYGLPLRRMLCYVRMNQIVGYGGTLDRPAHERLGAR